MTESETLLHAIRELLARAGSGSSDYDLTSPGLKGASPGLRPAGVLLPLIDRDGSLNVILTKRAPDLKHHAGQVSFPGGKLEPGDADARAAALREAREEIGLEPGNVRILGKCPDHETVTGYLMSPYVGEVLESFEPVPQAEEVAEIFDVPFRLLADPASYGVEERVVAGKRRRFYAVECGPHRIWGATAMILYRLAKRMPDWAEAGCK